MTVAGTNFEQRLGLASAVGGTAIALALLLNSSQTAFWPELFLYLSFGGAVLNVIGHDRATRQVSNVDIVLVGVTGFIAAAFAAPSIEQEAIRAVGRIVIIGCSVGALAWGYTQVRQQKAISSADVKLLAALSVALPLILTVYAIAFACGAAVIFAAMQHLRNGATLPSRQHIPVAGITAGTFYLVWLAYRVSV